MEHQGNTRRNFMKTTVAASTAALLAGVGFNRIASADDTSELITQVVTFKFSPDHKDHAVEALAKMAKAVEDNEPDVLAYIPHTYEKDDTHEIVFFEVYKNAAALANHSKQPALGELRKLFGSVFMPPFDIKKLSRIGGFAR